jgi:hypothetical protein
MQSPLNGPGPVNPELQLRLPPTYDDGWNTAEAATARVKADLDPVQPPITDISGNVQEIREAGRAALAFTSNPHYPILAGLLAKRAALRSPDETAPANQNYVYVPRHAAEEPITVPDSPAEVASPDLVAEAHLTVRSPGDNPDVPPQTGPHNPSS